MAICPPTQWRPPYRQRHVGATAPVARRRDMNNTFKNYLSNLKSKQVAVIGAGVSNTPLIDALLKAGVETTVRDRRTHDEMGDTVTGYEERGAKIITGDGYLDKLTEEVIFRTPGLMPTNPALLDATAHGSVLTSEMEVFFDVCPCKIIGITGSDGKTTTTSIIAGLLESQGKAVHTGGNIGTPLLSLADDMRPDDIAVVELSSFQLITMQSSPAIAVVTNIAPNHLDIHTDTEEYIEAKRNIFKHQKQTDRAVFNLDNDVTRNYAREAPALDILMFSRRETVKNGVYLKNGTIYEASDGVPEAVLPVGEIKLPGLHNAENFLAAFAAVRGLVSYDVMRETARTFKGVAHRIELVREHHGVRYYNDSIASSPSRTIAGLRAFEEKVILIAGGKDKGVAFDELGTEIAGRVKKLVLTGSTANQLYDAVIKAPGYDETLEIHKCDDFADAVHMASKVASNGDVVLLSPACTSFDRFRNFEERGNTFREIVNKL